MARTLFALIALLIIAPPAHADSQTAQLRYSKECILNIVASRMKVTLKPEIAPPTVHLKSEVTLKDFQDAVESWWGFRPDGVTNVFIGTSNQIFLTDDASAYQKSGRAIDDSLAHEYAHFFQVKYLDCDLSNQDTAELEAINVQTWFRENFIAQPGDTATLCPAPATGK